MPLEMLKKAPNFVLGSKTSSSTYPLPVSFCSPGTPTVFSVRAPRCSGKELVLASSGLGG